MFGVQNSGFRDSRPKGLTGPEIPTEEGCFFSSPSAGPKPL